MRILVLSLLALAPTSTALAQGTIQWLTDPRTAIQQAQASGRPMMVYVRASSSERSDEDDVDRDHQKSFRDPRVLQIAASFVPLRLSASRDRQILGDFGLSQSASMEMAFVTPEGEPLGPTLSAGGIGQPDSLAKRLRQALDAYGVKIYNKELKPVLEDKDARPDAIKQALGRTADIGVRSADRDVSAILERDPLEASVKNAALTTLATLSTPTAAKALLKQARKEDAVAIKQLERLTPVGAEALLDELIDKDGKVDFIAYNAVVRAMRIAGPKPKKFFESASAEAVKKETERVRGLAKGVIEDWKKNNE
jgi:hypothetical protein